MAQHRNVTVRNWLNFLQTTQIAITEMQTEASPYGEGGCACPGMSASDSPPWGYSCTRQVQPYGPKSQDIIVTIKDPPLPRGCCWDARNFLWLHNPCPIQVHPLIPHPIVQQTKIYTNIQNNRTTS